MATLILFGGGSIELDPGAKKVDVVPRAAIELVVEMDSRWMSEELQQSFAGSIKDGFKNLLLSRVDQRFPVSDLFAHNAVDMESFSLSPCRIRLSEEQAGRVLRASEEHLFARPFDGKQFDGKFAIVWAALHDIPMASFCYHLCWIG